MSAHGDYRARKRAAGLCEYGGCRSQRVTASYCETHRQKHLAWRRDYLARLKALREVTNEQG